MLRRLFTFLSVVSLLLCVATCVLWVRSFDGADRVRWTSGSGTYHCLSSWSGGLSWETDRPCPYDLPPIYDYVPHKSTAGIVAVVPVYFYVPAPDGRYWYPPTWSEDGTVLYASAIGGNKSFPTVHHGWVAFATAALPLFLIGSAIKRALRRQPPALCLSCGYDLRASPERCPECGTTIISATTKV